MHIERVRFERTGGFAGIHLSTDLKVDELPDEQANSLMELIDDMDFSQLPEKMIDEDGPDQFTYVITVEAQKWEHTVVTGDASAPEKMQELLQLLNRLARRRKRH